MPPVVAVQAPRQVNYCHQSQQRAHANTDLIQMASQNKFHADRFHVQYETSLDTAPVGTPPQSIGMSLRLQQPQPGYLHNSELLIPVLDAALALRVTCNDARLAAQAKSRRFASSMMYMEKPRALHDANTFSECPASPYVDSGAMSIFHLVEAPSISPTDYLTRLARYSYCSKSVFVGALLLLDRLSVKVPSLAPTSVSVHRLLLTAVLLVTKSFDDELYDNAHFAKVGGLSLADLNALELAMLKLLNFKLHITDKEFAQFEQDIVTSVLQTIQPAYRNLRYSLRKAGFTLSPGSLPGSPLSITEYDAAVQEDGRSPSSVLSVEDKFVSPCSSTRRAHSFGSRSDVDPYCRKAHRCHK